MTDQPSLDLANGQMNDPAPIRKFILGGNATFTLRSLITARRFTYKVKSATRDKGSNWSTGNQDRDTYFVSVLTGPDTSTDFEYIGLLSKQADGSYRFRSTAKSRAKEGSGSFDGFLHCWNMVEQGCRWPSQVEFFHEGRCAACGRKLTVPESIAAGFGPECDGKEF